MNWCVLKTFGKKLAKGTMTVVLCCGGLVAVFGGLIYIAYLIGDRWNAILDEIMILTCLSGIVVIVPLAVGYAVLSALKDAYKECSR